MSSSTRRDFSFLCEEFGEEFDKKTNNRDFLDLEDDGWMEYFPSHWTCSKS